MARLSFGAARHTWASRARRKNIAISVISEGLGHTTERTTRIYLEEGTLPHRRSEPYRNNAIRPDRLKDRTSDAPVSRLRTFRTIKPRTINRRGPSFPHRISTIRERQHDKSRFQYRCITKKHSIYSKTVYLQKRCKNPEHPEASVPKISLFIRKSVLPTWFPIC